MTARAPRARITVTFDLQESAVLYLLTEREIAFVRHRIDAPEYQHDESAFKAARKANRIYLGQLERARKALAVKLPKGWVERSHG